jgi:hypothetical protein
MARKASPVQSTRSSSPVSRWGGHTAMSSSTVIAIISVIVALPPSLVIVVAVCRRNGPGLHHRGDVERRWPPHPPTYPRHRGVPALPKRPIHGRFSGPHWQSNLAAIAGARSPTIPQSIVDIATWRQPSMIELRQLPASYQPKRSYSH